MAAGGIRAGEAAQRVRVHQRGGAARACCGEGERGSARCAARYEAQSEWRVACVRRRKEGQAEVVA